MNKSRLEAYTDAIIAIIITLMVLNIQPPNNAIYFHQLGQSAHQFFIYTCSFLLLSMYWNNHYHLLQPVKQINGTVLWMNNLFIFTMTLIPFATHWLTNHLDNLDPELLYGTVVLAGDSAYALLTWALLKANPGKMYHQAMQSQIHKLYLSLTFNVLGLLSAFIKPVLTLLISGGVVILLWFIPDRSMEKLTKQKNINHQ